MIPSSSYVPFLKWKQSEYQALYKLDEQVKDAIIPFIIIPPIEYDFAEKQMKKTFQDHMKPMPERLEKKWGKRLAIIDFHPTIEDGLMDDGASAISYFFTEAHAKGCSVIPTITLNKSNKYIQLITQLFSEQSVGVALRLYINDLTDSDLNNKIASLLQTMNLSTERVDLIIDLNIPDRFEPYTILANILHFQLNKILNFHNYRSLVVAAHSLKWGEIKQPGDLFVRHEWFLYQELLQKFQNKVPSFGDYTTENIDFLEQMDMRVIQPSAKLIYTTGDYVRVLKGKSFRANPGQMQTLCNSIVTSKEYYGQQFSFGDDRIYQTSAQLSNTGNLGTWKEAGINHHMTAVVSQLSNLHVEPSTS